MKKIIYWGKNWLGEMAMVFVGSLVMLLVFCAGGELGDGQGMAAGLRGLCSLFPYYMMIVGGFVLMIMTTSYFQGYFSLLVSMNARRSEVVEGVMGVTAMTILSIMGVSAVLWSLVKNDISAGGMTLLPLFAGVLFGMSGLFGAMGAVITRWGKIGTVIFVLICMAAGGALGASLAMLRDKEDIFAMHRVMITDLPGWFNFWIVLAVGLVIYLLAGVFILGVMRKQEVKA